MADVQEDVVDLADRNPKRPRLDQEEDEEKAADNAATDKKNNGASASAGQSAEEEIGSVEAELYDRQIRLWGAEAQKRIQNAKILIIGLNGLGAEVAKNIILGGVKSVVLMDTATVTELDASSQFLVSRQAIGQNRAEASLESAQKLNPLVQVTALTQSAAEASDDFYKQFDVICSIQVSKEVNIRLSQIAHEAGIAFYAGDVFGFLGYITIDLGLDYKYTKERKVLKTETEPEHTVQIECETKFAPYEDIVIQDKDDNPLWSGKRTPPALFAFYVLLDFFEEHYRHPNPSWRERDLKELLKFRDNFCRRQGVSVERVPDEMFDFVFGELGPVCAVTGGVLAQEIVKAISRRDEPLNNLFLYHPLIGTGVVVTAN